MKGNGKTSLAMNSATNMSWDIISQNLSGNWYVAKIAMTENHMVQFIGVRSCSMEETASLKRLDWSYLDGKQQDTISVLPEFLQHFIVYSWQGETGGDMIEFELMGLVAILFNWKHFLFHGKSSIRDSSLVGGKAKKSDKLYSSLHWIPGEMRLKKHSKVTCQNRERYTAGQSGNTLRTPEGKQ